MSNLFFRAKRKNFSGIESWDTSNVITMEGMFARCTRFNIPIRCWNVNSIENMESMFNGAKIFNQSLDKWRPVNLKNQNHMFYNCKSFTYSFNNKHEEPTYHVAIVSIKR